MEFQTKVGLVSSFLFCTLPPYSNRGWAMPDIHFIRDEIDRMRIQAGRQRKEILQLAGISTASAELLLGRMLAKIETLCAQRDELKKSKPGPVKGKVLGGRSW